MAQRVISCGIIAGMCMADILASAPGLVLDIYWQRVQYDMALHGCKLKEDA